MTPIVPTTRTSLARAQGRFDKNDFVYQPDTDSYRCPAGETLTPRFTTVEAGKTLHVYWTTACPGCVLKARCTTAKLRRVRRWEHEAVLDAMQKRLEAMPDAMTIRRSTVEHVFGTLKHWMGAAPFLTKGLRNVGTETSLAVLAYNLKRTISIMGSPRSWRQSGPEPSRASRRQLDTSGNYATSFHTASTCSRHRQRSS